MSELILKKRGGENCPFYRTTESKRELLESLASDVVEEAIEEGYGVGDLDIEYHYHHSGLEPHCCFAEVKVFYRYG